MKILYGDRLVTELRKQSDKIEERLWITVPFIGGLATVRKIIGRTWIENPAISVRLLADTNEFNNFNSETIKLFNERGEIKHLAGLHAKIFIADDECLITSANLTNTAFSMRHEIGIFLDKANAAKAIAIFEAWWKKSHAVSLDSLNTFIGRQFDSKEEREGKGLQKIWMLPSDPGKPSGNLEKQFLNYDSLLRDYSDFATKYESVQKDYGR